MSCVSFSFVFLYFPHKMHYVCFKMFLFATHWTLNVECWVLNVPYNYTYQERLTMSYSRSWRIKLKIGTLHILNPSIFVWYFDMIFWSTSRNNSIFGQNKMLYNQYFDEVQARDENIQLKTHKLYTLHETKWVKTIANVCYGKHLTSSKYSGSFDMRLYFLYILVYDSNILIFYSCKWNKFRIRCATCVPSMRTRSRSNTNYRGQLYNHKLFHCSVQSWWGNRFVTNRQGIRYG